MRHGNKTGTANQVISFAICILTILVSILSACTPQISIPTRIPTNSSTPKPLATSTPFPTSTLRPTFTPTTTPTADVITALASEFNIPVICLFTYQVSRDRNWIGADCNTSHELIITQKGTSNKIEISYQDILDKNLNAFTTKPLSWSSDSRYFYFTTATVCCSDYNQFEGNGALYQYDTKANTWHILVKASYKPYYFFSDGGEHFVYIRNSNSPYEDIEIGMVEILTKKSKRVVLKGYIIDNPEEYAWSSSMDRFAIVLWELQYRNNTPGDVLLKIDFTKMDMELVEEFNRNNLFGEN